jgi:hypothetical protein
MKTLLSSLLLFMAVATTGQTITNIAIRVTVDVVETGVSTNTAQTTLNLKAATQKEQTIITGLAWAHQIALDQGLTTNSFDFWLAREKIRDDAKAKADAYNRIQSSITLDRIQRLLTTELGTLDASDLAALTIIASKAP